MTEVRKSLCRKSPLLGTGFENLVVNSEVRFYKTQLNCPPFSFTDTYTQKEEEKATTEREKERIKLKAFLFFITMAIKLSHWTETYLALFSRFSFANHYH